MKGKNIPVAHVTINLKTHQQSDHEGKKYQCGSCDFQAKQSGNLKTHQKSVHEGNK